MKAPPANAERPSLDSARKGSWFAWFLQEWGLLLLAAVLAVIIWEITSQRVIEPRRIEDVAVRLVIPAEARERVGAVLHAQDPTVTLELTGSERQMYAVLAALNRTGGGTPAIELEVDPAFENPSRPLSEMDAWRWPVAEADEMHLKATSIPAGTVYRIEGMQQVHVAHPPTIPSAEALREAGYVLQLLDPDTPAGATIQVSPGVVEFLAPRAILADGDGPLVMTPDPIDLRTLYMKPDGSGERDAPKLGVVQSFELTFTDWASVPGPVGVYRKKLPTVKATARLALQRVEKRALANRIEALLNPAFTWDFDGTPVTTIDRVSSPNQFTGHLTGPADALDEIAKNRDQWMWAIYVSEPDDGWPKKDAMGNNEDASRKGVRATIVWVPQDPSWIRRGVRFVPEAANGEDIFSLKLELRKPGDG